MKSPFITDVIMVRPLPGGREGRREEREGRERGREGGRGEREGREGGREGGRRSTVYKQSTVILCSCGEGQRIIQLSYIQATK